MENYSKGKNVEEPLERERIPIPDLPPGFLWMQVRGGSKLRNLLTHALNEFPEVKSVVWTGFGPAVGKTISCAEIMKRKLGDNIHQITKLCYRTVDEYWDPKIPELDQIVVKRKLPMIHILLSSTPLNADELGYQAPGATVEFHPERKESNKQKQRSGKPSRTPTKEFAALGVDSKKRTKKPNQSNKRKWDGKNAPRDSPSASTDS